MTDVYAALGGKYVHPDQFTKYAWVDEIEAWTIAVITGRAAEEVVRIYGGDADDPLGDLTFGEAERKQDFDSGGYAVQVFTHGEYVVAIEPNNYSGSLPEIARRCSAQGGSFFSVFWNVNAAGDLTQAIDGEITAQFASLYPVAPARSHEIRPSWAVGPETDVEVVGPVAVALMEQQTGLAIEEGWLSESLPTYEIPDPYELYRDVSNAGRP